MACRVCNARTTLGMSLACIFTQIVGRAWKFTAAFKSEAMWTLADFSADGAMYCKEFAEVMTRILVEVCTADCLIDFIAFHVFDYEI